MPKTIGVIYSLRTPLNQTNDMNSIQKIEKQLNIEFNTSTLSTHEEVIDEIVFNIKNYHNENDIVFWFLGNKYDIYHVLNVMAREFTKEKQNQFKCIFNEKVISFLEFYNTV